MRFTKRCSRKLQVLPPDWRERGSPAVCSFFKPVVMLLGKGAYETNEGNEQRNQY
jgi:hypothetical protein